MRCGTSNLFGFFDEIPPQEGQPTSISIARNKALPLGFNVGRVTLFVLHLTHRKPGIEPVSQSDVCDCYYELFVSDRRHFHADTSHNV